MDQIETIVTRKGTKYLVSYPEGSEYENIRMRYKGIDKNYYALVSIWYGRAEVYVEARVNLLSQRALKDVAQFCDLNLTGFPWGTIVVQASKKVRDKHEEGNAVVNLKTQTISDELQYHVDPFLIYNQHNLIYGDGGLGKSWFAVYMATLVTTGLPHGKLQGKKSNVLYLDYEVDQQDMTNRFIALCEGIGVTEIPNFYYRKQFISVSKDEDRLRDIVAEYDIGLVIVDSAAAACGGEPENASVATSYWNSLSSLECTTLTIAHVSKSEASERGTSTPYGSVFWRNMPRNAWEIRKNNTSNKLETHFGLTQTKINSGGGDRPRNFKFIFDNPKLANSVSVIETDITDNDKLMEAGTGKSQAIAVIKDARSNFYTSSSEKRFPGVTVQDCIDRYGKSDNSYRQAFSNNSDIFVQISRGHYDLKAEVDADDMLLMQEPTQAVQFK